MLTWLKFNAVGIAGALVQLFLLWVFVHLLRIEYLMATALAVELAVLHNFAWHEVWTWRGMATEGRFRRLVRFHAANGMISLAGNALFTWIFHQITGMPVLAANLAAIGVTSLINFALAAMWVFTEQSPSDRAVSAPAFRRRDRSSSGSR